MATAIAHTQTYVASLKWICHCDSSVSAKALWRCVWGDNTMDCSHTTTLPPTSPRSEVAAQSLPLAAQCFCTPLRIKVSLCRRRIRTFSSLLALWIWAIPSLPGWSSWSHSYPFHQQGDPVDHSDPSPQWPSLSSVTPPPARKLETWRTWHFAQLNLPTSNLKARPVSGGCNLGWWVNETLVVTHF